MISRTINRYQIQTELGRGGMGTAISPIKASPAYIPPPPPPAYMSALLAHMPSSSPLAPMIEMQPPKKSKFQKRFLDGFALFGF